MPLPDFSTIEQYVRFIRDIGLILGVPTLFVIGRYLHGARIKALKAQLALAEQMRYDNAWSVIDAQRKVSERAAELLREKIESLELALAERDERLERGKGLDDERRHAEQAFLLEHREKEREVTQLKEELEDLKNTIETLKRNKEVLEKSKGKVYFGDLRLRPENWDKVLAIMFPKEDKG